MKKMIAWTLTGCFFLSFAAETVKWDSATGFDSWKIGKATGGSTGKGFVFSDIQEDTRMINTQVDLDPSKYNAFQFRYRATDVPKSFGELFFAGRREAFSGRKRWNFPSLISDGQWHVMTIHISKAMKDRNVWEQNGPVFQLRLDPTNKSGGKIEISEIRFLSIPDCVRWDKNNGFEGWNSSKNLKMTVSDDAIVLTEIGNDCRIMNMTTDFETKNCNTFNFTYRAEGIGKSKGELFFAGKDKKFGPDRFVYLPPLNGDGKWHTVSVPVAEMCQNWEKTERIYALRFDPVNTAGGKIEISEMYFTMKKNAFTDRSKIDAATALDEPLWQDVKTEFRAAKKKSVQESYFQGKMIRAPEDLPSGSKYSSFFLRKKIHLKQKPAFAFLQYIADDEADVFFNGTLVSQSGNWKITEQKEVTSFLNQGDNVWAFKYGNRSGHGGVLGELFVRYADGSSERFNTDDAFCSAVTEFDKWNSADCDDGKWDPVVAQDGPPAAPWSRMVNYCGTPVVQKYLGGSRMPAVCEAGKPLHLEFSFEGKPPKDPVKISLDIRWNNLLLWNEKEFTLSESNIKRTGENRWNLSFDYVIPLCLSSRKNAAITLNSNSFVLLENKKMSINFDLIQAKKDPAFPDKLESCVKKTAYGPTILVNGTPFYSVEAAKWQIPDDDPSIGKAPYNTVTIYYGVYSRTWWPKTDVFEFHHFDRIAEMYRRAYKDAYFMWDIMVLPPPDWAMKHPGQMCTDDAGNIISWNSSSWRWTKGSYSFSSLPARIALADAVKKAIRYLENTSYANRIVGYHVNSGYTTEWLGWNPAKGHATDFSAAAQEGYREFIRKEYPGLKDCTIPSLKERESTAEKGLLFDMREKENVIAFNDYLSNSVAETLIHLCKAAKEELKEKKLVGTYYGYCCTLNAPGQSQMRAHYALEKVLKSGAVDFLMSPQAYGIRTPGMTCGDMKPFGSIAANNVVPWIEDDSRTHNSRCLNTSIQTPTEALTIGIMRRNMAIALCRNQPLYYYAHAVGTEFDFPAMEKDIAAEKTVGDFCLKKQVTRNAEIAIVFSEKTITSMPMLTEASVTGVGQYYDKNGKAVRHKKYSVVHAGESYGENLNRFARIGAPCDYLLAEDLKKHPGNYKLYIFVNCFRYDREFLQAVRKLQEKECVMLWCYAPGIMFGGNSSVENMKQLTGFTFIEQKDLLRPAVKMADDRIMGTVTIRTKPFFSVLKDDAVKILGIYENGEIGAAERRQGKALSVFSGTYHLDMQFLTELAKRAKVHIYSESSDPMEANASLFTLHARFPGKKVVRLPKKTKILDVFNKKLIADNQNEFSFEAPIHSTSLFYFGDDAEELLKLLAK